nr:MAG TPA: hypothetical protein [Caudoviricetes sp.]
MPLKATISIFTIYVFTLSFSNILCKKRYFYL